MTSAGFFWWYGRGGDLHRLGAWLLGSEEVVVTWLRLGEGLF